jgi:hypothetical protein
MSDAGIKKVTILKSDIDAVAGVSQNYVLRYRIISEDKNRSSHWSPQYRLIAPTVETVDHSVTVNGSTITCVWEHAQALGTDKYDVYINWETNPAIPKWEYISTVSSPSFATIKKSGSTKVQIAVQSPTFPKERFTASTLFQSIQYSV